MAKKPIDNVSTHTFSTPVFQRKLDYVGPTRRRTIGPIHAKDKGTQLEQWLDENTVSPAVPFKEDMQGIWGNRYTYFDGNSLCGITSHYQHIRDDHGFMEYNRTVTVRVQPPGEVPGELVAVLKHHGYVRTVQTY